MHIDLGLKSSVAPEQLNNRLMYKPDVFELFTSEEDFTADGLKRVADAIEKVKSEATNKIVIHHPMRYHNEFTEIIAPQKSFPELYYFIDRSTNDLLQLAFDYDIQVLVHGSYSRHTNNFIALYPNLNSAKQAAFSRLDKFAILGQKHIMFENSISPIFYYGEKKEDMSILAKNYRLAFDTSHCFIKQRGSNKDLLASLKRLRSQIVHYHLVDSKGKKHDSLPLGEGNIDWESVLPLLNPNATSIYEINLKDQTDATEQLQSHEYLLNLANKFHL